MVVASIVYHSIGIVAIVCGEGNYAASSPPTDPRYTGVLVKLICLPRSEIMHIDPNACSKMRHFVGCVLQLASTVVLCHDVVKVTLSRGNALTHIVARAGPFALLPGFCGWQVQLHEQPDFLLPLIRFTLHATSHH